MKIYIDNDNKCYTTDDGTRRAFETEMITDFFKDKCTAYIESFRYIPEGETWTRSDGKEFAGESITAYRDYDIAKVAQEQYEAMLPEMEDMKTALNILGNNGGKS